MSVATHDWAVLSRLLDTALSMPPDERVSWVEQLQGEHQSLKPVLRDLLARKDLLETGGFLATLPKLTGVLADGHVDGAPGEVIGPYRLVHQIGSGGMGSVWLAERADGLLKRRIALKLPHVGGTFGGLAQRMARERDILAALEHPHIARLYDAGVASDGRPYLALEYIEGEAIDGYCRAREIDIPGRIDLVLQVARAVAYAHAHLVVHRDLKPSNILVDTLGCVHLLDFGVAKLLDENAAGAEGLTQFAGRALTPEYASPEQLRGEPVSTASDVYSLGVILYELLAGVSPYRLRSRVNPLELAQAVIASEPVSPSDATSGAAARRQLRGDLDTIVLKALKKRQAERYATVAQLADDLERFLSGEPVLARPDSRWYRTRKFAARHKLAIAAVASVVVALIAGLGTAAWQAEVARGAAVHAEREARRARAVQAFLVNLFDTNTDAQADPVQARQTTARDLLDRGAARVGAALRDSPEAEDEVLGTLADMYRAVGSDDDVAEMDRQRIDVRRRMYGAHDVRVAEALIEYANGVESTADRLKAPALLKQARAIMATTPNVPVVLRIRLLEETARTDKYIAVTDMRDNAHAANLLIQQFKVHTDEFGPILRFEARAQTWLGNWAAAVSLHERSLAEASKLAPAGVDLVITNLLELADVHALMAHIQTAERLFRQTLQLSQQRNGESHVDTLHVEARFATFLHQTGRVAEARELQERALRQAGQDKATDTPNVIGQIQRTMATNLLDEGQLEAAAPFIANDVSLRRRVYPNSITLASALYNQSRLAFALGHQAEADQLLDEAWKISRAALGSGRQPVTDNPFLLLRAQLRIAEGRVTDAVADLRAIATADPPAGAQLAVDAITARIWLAAADLRLGDNAGALREANSAVNTLQGSALRRFYPTLEADAALRLGQAQLRLGDPRAARITLQNALELRMAIDHPNSPRIAQTSRALAESLLALGLPKEAHALQKRAAGIFAIHPELGAQFHE
jgi:serine/threonine-protein kinase